MLFILVHSDSQIESMMVFGKEVTLTSFSFDATYLLLNLASVYQLFRVFGERQSLSSFEVSREKSETSGLIWISQRGIKSTLDVKQYPY